jgi:hypothetical protein
MLESVARSAGFEPTTPWFVARYSIQLSYERAVKKRHCINLHGRVNPHVTHTGRVNPRFRIRRDAAKLPTSNVVPRSSRGPANSRTTARSDHRGGTTLTPSMVDLPMPTLEIDVDSGLSTALDKKSNGSECRGRSQSFSSASER